MIVVHAVWTEGALALWGESDGPGSGAGEGAHPHAERADRLRDALAASDPELASVLGASAELSLRLPALEGEPARSPKLAHLAGVGAGVGGASYDDEGEAAMQAVVREIRKLEERGILRLGPADAA